VVFLWTPTSKQSVQTTKVELLQRSNAFFYSLVRQTLMAMSSCAPINNHDRSNTEA
jgi:hypothetical protein